MRMCVCKWLRTLGLPALAPFDAIVVTASAEEPPQPYLEQLDDGRRLVISIGNRQHQALFRITRHYQAKTPRRLSPLELDSPASGLAIIAVERETNLTKTCNNCVPLTRRAKTRFPGLTPAQPPPPAQPPGQFAIERRRSITRKRHFFKFVPRVGPTTVVVNELFDEPNPEKRADFSRPGAKPRRRCRPSSQRSRSPQQSASERRIRRTKAKCDVCE